jgi:hypothetical protein
MQTTIAWLDRLRGASSDIQATYHRVVVPGFTPLEMNECIIAAQGIGPMPSILSRSSPEVLSQLRLPEIPSQSAGGLTNRQLIAELSAILSIALDRRIEILQETSIDVAPLRKIIFLPYNQAIDRTILAPLPGGECARVQTLLASIAGLGEMDAETIGAAATLLHGALLLFDRDLGAAYTLLVGGIEVLSRAYGDPPSAWSEWDQAADWDRFIVESALNDVQAASLRTQLMHDRHLRLKATFRSYASQTLPDSFWEKSWPEWMWGVNANRAEWTEGTQIGARLVADFLPRDRELIARALGRSYDVRSGVVHKGKWIRPMELILPPAGYVEGNAPLPFAVLRSMLSELIKAEIEARSTGIELPELQLILGPFPPGDL